MFIGCSVSCRHTLTFLHHRSIVRRFTPSEPQRHREHRELHRENIPCGAREPIDMLESEIHLSLSATFKKTLCFPL